LLPGGIFYEYLTKEEYIVAFCYLLLGHLLGDFVLQTNRIAVNKPLYRSWGIVHAVIVTLCMLIFSIPFGLTSMLLVIPAGVLHFIIDKTKSHFSDKYKLPELPAFLADQVLHVGILYFVSRYAVINYSFLLLSKCQAGFMVAAILVTFFAAILNQYILAIFCPRPGNVLFWKGEKLFGNTTRFILFTAFFLFTEYSYLYLLILLLVPVAYIIKEHFYGRYPMGKYEAVLKLLLDILVSALGSAIVSFL
jgi:hypothetical protein